MKWMIASDIHGSALYCGQMLRCFENEKADRLLLLGDLLYHGPRNDLPAEYQPKKVIEMLNAVRDRLLCVRGNCDCEVDQMVLQFPILADYAVLDAGERLIYATHGHVYNPDKLPALKQGDVLLFGHTHVPLHTEKDGILCMNPGSVSIPKEGSAHGYMIYEDGLFCWKTLDGEVYDRLSTK
ncbi:MAG: phosphodiesterase [Clostridia bacterium]|nr:phosphodiesterase [Clostridia bacterium]